jgi:hypothetical protein
MLPARFPDQGAYKPDGSGYILDRSVLNDMGTWLQSNHRSVGRPREFDEEAVLECAMGAFWRKGYEATSLTDLRFFV